jgi:hypothetical protein
MVIRKVRRLLLTTSVVVAALLLGAEPALASSATSILQYYGPVQGIAYSNQSQVSNSPGPEGHVNVADTNHTTIPAGWSGGQASVYLNGALCGSAAMWYEPNPSTSWGGGTVTPNCGHGNYTTRGSTAAYNGSGYNYYYTATSPIVTY